MSGVGRIKDAWAFPLNQMPCTQERNCIGFSCILCTKASWSSKRSDNQKVTTLLDVQGHGWRRPEWPAKRKLCLPWLTMASPAWAVSHNTRKLPKNISHLKSYHIPGSIRQVFICLFVCFLIPNLEESESKASNMVEKNLEVNKKSQFSYWIRGKIDWHRLWLRKTPTYKSEAEEDKENTIICEGSPELQEGRQEKWVSQGGGRQLFGLGGHRNWGLKDVSLSREWFSWSGRSGSNFKLENAFMFSH